MKRKKAVNNLFREAFYEYSLNFCVVVTWITKDAVSEGMFSITVGITEFK